MEILPKAFPLSKVLLEKVQKIQGLIIFHCSLSLSYTHPSYNRGEYGLSSPWDRRESSKLAYEGIESILS